MPSYFKRIALDAQGIAGSIKGPLSVNNTFHENEASSEPSQPRNPSRRKEALHSMPGDSPQQASTMPSTLQAVELPASRPDPQGLPTIETSKTVSRTTKKQDGTKRFSGISEGAKTAPAKQQEDRPESTAEQQIASLRDDAEPVKNQTHHRPSSTARSEQQFNPVHQESTQAAKPGVRANDVNKAPNIVKGGLNQQRLLPRLENQDSENDPFSPTKAPADLSMNEKAGGPQRQELPEKGYHTQVVTTAETPGPRQPMVKHTQSIERQKSFQERHFHSTLAPKRESPKPVVHIGQIDIIIEAPPAVSSNKDGEPTVSSSSLNASASFLRKL